MEAQEEEEEASHSRDDTVKKKHTCTTHLWSHVHDHLEKKFIIRRESLKFFGEMSHMLLQCRKLLRLGARYRLQAPNDWDTTSHTQVLGYSIEESIHTISIASTERSYFHPQIWIKIRVGRRIVLVSLSPPAVICLLEIKTKIIKFNTRK
jgi:hypothetical protein